MKKVLDNPSPQKEAEKPKKIENVVTGGIQ